MKVDLTKKYVFKNYDCEAYLTDFRNFDPDRDNVYLHEEIQTEIPHNSNIDEFEPIIVMPSFEEFENKNSNSADFKFIYLLDGHHRWNFAQTTHQIHKLKCIFVNPNEVNLYSFIFELKVQTEIFKKMLEKNKFKTSEKSFNTIRFNNKYFSSPLFKNKLDLYDFKKVIQESGLIKPATTSKIDSKKIISFAPIEKKEIMSLKHLLPPKSTWITPRI